MSNAIQSKLGNFFGNELDVSPVTATEFVHDIPISDIAESIDLPPDYAHAKYFVMDLFKIAILHEVKGFPTLKKTYRYLQNNPEELKKLNIALLPDYHSIVYFIRERLGKELLQEVKIAINEYKHNCKFFIRDNIQDYKHKKNFERINSKKLKPLLKIIMKDYLKKINDHPEFNQTYSTDYILRMLYLVLCNPEHSIHSYTEYKRDDIEMNKRGVPTGKTVINKLREIFRSKDDVEKYLDELIEKAILMARRLNPELFNRQVCRIALDCTLIPSWEKPENLEDPRDIMGDAHAKVKGTTVFRMYLVCSIIIRGYKFAVAVIPLKDGMRSDIHKLVEKIIIKVKSLIQVKVVLFDKEFETYEVIALLKNMKLLFVCPSKRRLDVKQTAALSNDEIVIDKRVIYNEEVATLVVFKNPTNPDENVYFTTNMNITKENAHELIEIYKTRWCIETTFEQIKFFTPYTTTNNTLLRNLFYYSAVIIHNLWILTNLAVMLLYMKKITNKPPIKKLRFTGLTIDILSGIS